VLAPKGVGAGACVGRQGLCRVTPLSTRAERQLTLSNGSKSHLSPDYPRERSASLSWGIGDSLREGASKPRQTRVLASEGR
jgi:hypothetical protein